MLPIYKQDTLSYGKQYGSGRSLYESSPYQYPSSATSKSSCYPSPASSFYGSASPNVQGYGNISPQQHSSGAFYGNNVLDRESFHHSATIESSCSDEFAYWKHCDYQNEETAVYQGPMTSKMNEEHAEARARTLKLLSKNSAWYYEVEFKGYRREIYAGSSDFKEGSYVVVEADRGLDLGHIVNAAQNLEELQPKIKSSNTEKRKNSKLKFVLGTATEDDLDILRQKFDEERVALSLCREKVRQRCLPMNVVDAEFQFDRHKLSFYYEANKRVEFNELVRDLFAVYKTRIWLQQLSR